MRKRPTISDVARRAGVSNAAVSFVLNDRSDQRISERVKRRVRDVATRLDYHPRASASNLARRSSRNVVVLLTRNAERVPSGCDLSLILGMVAEATRLDFNVFFSTIDTKHRAVPDVPKPIRECDAAGVLVISAASPSLLLDMKSRDIPVVSVDIDQSLVGAVMFPMNHRRGGELAAEYLASLGHGRLAAVTCRERCQAFDERIEGFVSACHNREIAFGSGDLVAAGESTYEAGLRCGQELLRQTSRPSAVLALTEELGAGILSAARDMGLLIPGELSVLGFSSTLLGNPIDPTLTTVSADAESVGRYAMSRLLDGLRTEAPEPREPSDFTIVTRTSTGPLTRKDSRARPRTPRPRRAEDKAQASEWKVGS